MAWVKLDHAFPTHPKVLAAGPNAAWLYVEALCYSAFHLTNGVISPAVLRNFSQLSRPVLHAKTLVSVGLWEVISDEEGWLIHDYDRYQSTREQVERQRIQTAQRVRRHRGNSDVTPLRVVDVTPLEQEEKRNRTRKETTPLSASHEADFSDWYLAYPRHEAKVEARKAYAKALKRTDSETLLAAAERYRDDPNRTPSYTKLPATWLNQGCWDDEALPSRLVANGTPPRAGGARIPPPVKTCGRCDSGWLTDAEGSVTRCPCQKKS